MTPVRIQRKRTKGWRMPEGAIYVGRPSRWGNPLRAGDSVVTPHPGAHYAPFWIGTTHEVGSYNWFDVRRIADAAETVALFRVLVEYVGPELRSLRGHDLACWCPLDQPCHADVLLELANRP